MIDLLLLLLVPALKAVDGGSRHPAHIAAALAAWPLDILIARTTWRGIAGPLHKGEWTISDSLERLCHPDNAEHERYTLFCEIGREINRVSPTKRHIKILVVLQPNDITSAVEHR